MDGCRIAGCGQNANTLCTGGVDAVNWICETHRRKCGCYRCGKYQARCRPNGEYDTSDKKLILCPHCGEECNDEYESGYISEALKGDTFEVTCDHCDEEFDVEPHIDVQYSTSKKE